MSEPKPPDAPIEAEIVQHTQALAVRPETNLPTVQDLEQQFALAVRQRELLSDYIKKQLVPGKHFYEIAGSKSSLTKEGAEIILLPHNLAPDYELISGPDAPPADGRPYQITIKCVLRRKGDPNSFVGSGIGSAGSQKGKWDRGNWVYQDRQIDKYLCHNATLKMAEKSAMIAATLNSTAGSEFFTQDVDDSPPTPAQNVTGRPPGRSGGPSRTAERNASTCPVIGVFSGNDYNNLCRMLKPYSRTPSAQEVPILLRRLLQAKPKEVVSLAEPKGFCLLWHAGGDLRIEGEHRIVGEGILRVPGLVACMLLRHGDSQGPQTGQGGSDNRTLEQARKANDSGSKTGKAGSGVRSPGGGHSQGSGIPTTPARVATEATRAWMIKQLESCMQEALQFFIEIGAILPTESIDDLPLSYVPTSKKAMLGLISNITQFQVDGTLPKTKAVPRGAPAREESTEAQDDYDLTQYPFTIIVPIPRKGMKKNDYIKDPDTIGSLFASRHGTDEESQANRQRLWGFINHFEPKSWVDKQGQTRMPSKTDIDFRKALDVLADMLEKRGENL